MDNCDTFVSLKYLPIEPSEEYVQKIPYEVKKSLLFRFVHRADLLDLDKIDEYASRVISDFCVTQCSETAQTAFTNFFLEELGKYHGRN